AAQRAEQLTDGIQEVFSHPGAFEHQPHEGKERDGEQRVVAHHAIDAVRQRLQEIRLKQAKPNTDQSIEQADERQRECRWITKQQYDDQGAEHDRRHVLNKKSFHSASLGPRMRGAQRLSMASTICSTSASRAWTCVSCGSAMRPRMMA